MPQGLGNNTIALRQDGVTDCLPFRPCRREIDKQQRLAAAAAEAEQAWCVVGGGRLPVLLLLLLLSQPATGGTDWAWISHPPAAHVRNGDALSLVHRAP